jgi:hypothetical protein
MNDEPFYHMVRCAWCWREIQSDKAIVDGENYFCEESCQKKYSEPSP